MTNKDHPLTAKQEKLISRLAILSSSRKELDKVHVNFFASEGSLLMVASEAHSIMLISNREVCTKILLEGYERYTSLTASRFRLSSCFNKLGNIIFKTIGCLDGNNTAYLISKANYVQCISFEEDNNHLRKLDMDELSHTYLPKRLHSVFKNADCYHPDAKTIAVKTKLEGLNIIYLSELIH